MDEDLKLYIPLGVKPEAELFTGFGKKQLFQSIVGSLVMGGIAALAWLFTGNVTTTVILALNGGLNNVRNHSGLLPLAGGSRPKG